ncbi:hypothetical protein T492DRAFT_862035 [Pavlovales sp. CCMP2436]|nr:hypothetical protein T492DRAFT_862035 [Pavlovales sp. CCMP2436]
MEDGSERERLARSSESDSAPPSASIPAGEVVQASLEVRRGPVQSLTQRFSQSLTQSPAMGPAVGPLAVLPQLLPPRRAARDRRRSALLEGSLPPRAASAPARISLARARRRWRGGPPATGPQQREPRNSSTVSGGGRITVAGLNAAARGSSGSSAARLSGTLSPSIHSRRGSIGRAAAAAPGAQLLTPALPSPGSPLPSKGGDFGLGSPGLTPPTPRTAAPLGPATPASRSGSAWGTPATPAPLACAAFARGLAVGVGSSGSSCGTATPPTAGQLPASAHRARAPLSRVAPSEGIPARRLSKLGVERDAYLQRLPQPATGGRPSGSRRPSVALGSATGGAYKGGRYSERAASAHYLREPWAHRPRQVLPHVPLGGLMGMLGPAGEDKCVSHRWQMSLRRELGQIRVAAQEQDNALDEDLLSLEALWSPASSRRGSIFGAEIR